METLKKQKYLYYLQLGDNATPVYLQLAQKFKQFGIEIIPIQISEIDIFLKTGSENLIVVCQDFKQLEVLNFYSKKILNYILSSKSIRIFLFSSYELNDVLQKHQQRKKVIQYHLPLTLNRVVGEVVSQILSSRKEYNIWPGGKKSRAHQILVKGL